MDNIRENEISENEIMQYLKKMRDELEIENVQIIINKDNLKYYKATSELIERQKKEIQILTSLVKNAQDDNKMWKEIFNKKQRGNIL